ncbi:MAG TPA: ferritin family protein [Sedimentisphaerales bacterium]|nr:ferritin family protein [Sedimentisphaerales bacterium]
MGITFTADEIFEMAEQIERNGAEYYREAARNASDKDIKQMLLSMAAMEDGHLQTFEQMRKELSGREKEPISFDPDNQGTMYLQAMADARGMEGRISPAKKLTGNESTKEVLDIAINSEKDSVVFYLNLKDLVPVRAGRQKVEEIIMEELSHITSLLRKLKTLK